MYNFCDQNSKMNTNSASADATNPPDFCRRLDAKKLEWICPLSSSPPLLLMPSTLKPRPRSTCFPSPLPGSPSEGLGLSAMQGARSCCPIKDCDCCQQSTQSTLLGLQVPPTTQNVVGGQWLESSTDQWIEVHNPATNQVGGMEM